MRILALVVLWLGCSSSTATSVSQDCGGGGVHYDVAKSRFAFGGDPVAQPGPNGMTRYVGGDGVLAMFPDGSVLGVMNSGAPETTVADWSTDTVALSMHVREYFQALGASSCQMGTPEILGGSGGRVVTIQRRIDGIIVAESLADARFNRDDQTTVENFYWPTIPPDVVADARAFRDQLKDPSALEAYRAKLPPEARAGGEVVIHHTQSFSSDPFRAFAGWETLLFVGGMPTTSQTFDRDGKPIH